MTLPELRRLPDCWTRLDEWHQAARREPLVYGRTDCLLTPAAAVEAVTGANPAADLVGRYRTEAGAARLLRRLGGLRQAVTDRLGPPLEGWKTARRGDLVLVLDDGLEHVAVALGLLCALRAVHGLAHRPTAAGLLTWRVG